jgi:hypothetical protein
MLRSTFGLLVAVISSAYALIKPGEGLDTDPFMMQDDVYVYYMNRVFDVSQANGHPTFTSHYGWMRNYMTTISAKMLDENNQVVNALEYINNQTFAYVVDNKHATIQTMDLEGTSFVSEIDITFTLLGGNTRCDDIEVYYPTKTAYIVCWGVSSAPNPPGNIYLLSVDITNPNNKNTTVINQPVEQGFRAVHRLRIGLFPISQGSGSNDVYLLIWDQTPQGTVMVNSTWFIPFSNIQNGGLKQEPIVNVSAGFTGPVGINTMYDIFLFNNVLIISHNVAYNAPIALTGCLYTESNNSVYCDTTYSKTTSITQGYVGMTLGGLYISYDIQRNHYKSCSVGPNFFTNTWISTSCTDYFDMQPISDAFVVVVEDNYHAKLMTWVHPDGTYAGISVHSTELNKSWNEPDTLAILISNRLYVAYPSIIDIRRLEYDNLLVNSTSFPNQVTQLTITARDADNSMNVYSTFTIMTSMKDEIFYQEDKYLPEVDIYAGSTFYLPLAEDEYYGNNLMFTPRYDNFTGIIDGTVYTTFPINIIYTFKATGLPHFSEITFTNSHAVGKDLQNRIYLFHCASSSIDIFVCNEIYNLAVDDNDALQPTSLEVLGYVFSWTKDNVRSRVIMWNSESAETFTMSLPGAANDIHAVVVNNRLWIYASYQSLGIVYIYSWSPVAPKTFNTEGQFNVGNSYHGVYCPTDVFDTFNGTQGYVEVVSICNTTFPKDQRIFRYNATTRAMDGTHPIDLNITNPQVCAIGENYIIGSVEKDVLFGRSMKADESVFYYYLKEFNNFNQFVGLSCVEKSGVVVVNFKDQSNRLGYFTLWGNSIKQANKRIHSVMTNLASYTTSIQSFSVQGIVMHALFSPEGSLNYYMSLTTAPIIRMDVGYINQPQLTGLYSISMTNGGSSGASATSNATIRLMNTTINIDYNTKTPAPNDMNNFNIENYMNIHGHVFNATIADERIDKSTSVHLIQRFKKVYNFFPPIVDQVIFQHLEAHGAYMIALHTDRSYASFFTIFYNMTNQGVYQPRDGVLAFDFVPCTNNRALIAFGSTLNSGNKLNFILMQYGSLLTSFSLPVTTAIYTKLRFATIDGNDNYMLFAWNQVTGAVDVFTVKAAGLSISPIQVFTIPGVVDFDVTDPDAYINLFYVQDEANVLNVAAWQKSRTSGGPSMLNVVDVQGYHKYWLRTVSCVNHLPSSSACVINIIGSHFYELVIPNNQYVATQNNMIGKFGNFDGRYIYIDEQFIAMRAVTATQPHFYAFLAWKRPSMGGDGFLYYGKEIEGSDQPGLSIESAMTPFSLIQFNGNSVLFTGTHNPMEPLEFWQIGTFQLQASVTNGDDYTKIFLEVQGWISAVQSESIAQMTNQQKPTPPKPSSSNTWIYISLVIGGLILLAVLVFGIMFCKNNEKTDLYNNASVGYQTIGADPGRRVPSVNPNARPAATTGAEDV